MHREAPGFTGILLKKIHLSSIYITILSLFCIFVKCLFQVGKADSCFVGVLELNVAFNTR